MQDEEQTREQPLLEAELLRRAEAQAEISHELLNLANQCSSRKEYADAALERILHWSGCRNGGIRLLNESGDIPYESCKGFSQEFWESENWLSIRNDQCACTRTVCETPEKQDLPYMTEAGSFRCDDTLALLASLSEQQKTRFRGVCIKSGFKSVAIIPLRHEKKVFGAIHLADEREGMVPTPKVQCIESMAPMVAQAIKKFSLKEALEQNNDTLQAINALLSLSLSDIRLEDVLAAALDRVLTIPWLSFESTGAIFLVEDSSDVLEMKAQRGLSKERLKKCHRVPFGTCLCGKAAANGEIAHSGISGCSGATCHSHGPRHGHYLAPITTSGKVLGLINVYLREGHRWDQKEADLLSAVANALAGIIQRKRTEQAFMAQKSRLEALVRLNEMDRASVVEIGRYVLEEGLRLTQSTLGVISYVLEDKGITLPIYWSKKVLKECVLSKPIHFEIDESGIWAEAIRRKKPFVVTDYSQPQFLKRGYPPGHVKLRRILSVPVLDREDVVLLATLANKKADYTKTDIGQITALMKGMWNHIKRIRARDELRDSEARYRTLSRNFPNGAVWMYDRNLRHIVADGIGLSQIGLTKETAEKRTLWEIFPQDVVTLLEPHYLSALEGQAHVFELPHADEVYELHTLPIRDKFDMVVAGMVMMQNITERKRAEANTKMYMERLEKSNCDLQDFAFVASHDLQEPLRKILAFGDCLRLGCAQSLDDEGRDYLERMCNAAHRMRDLIQSLLNYSRLSTSTYSFSQVDLNDLVQRVLTDLDTLIERSTGKVHVEPLPTIQADPTQMRQLFQNLIANALKFQDSQKPLVNISSRLLSNTEKPTAGKWYEILVEDNGIGFEEKYADCMFSPFQRLHGKSAFEGIGMGLAICKKIIERHSGYITAQSTPGEGSTFLITLPAERR